MIAPSSQAGDIEAEEEQTCRFGRLSPVGALMKVEVLDAWHGCQFLPFGKVEQRNWVAGGIRVFDDPRDPQHGCQDCYFSRLECEVSA